MVISYGGRAGGAYAPGWSCDRHAIAMFSYCSVDVSRTIHDSSGGAHLEACKRLSKSSLDEYQRLS